MAHCAPSTALLSLLQLIMLYACQHFTTTVSLSTVQVDQLKDEVTRLTSRLAGSQGKAASAAAPPNDVASKHMFV